MKEKFFISIILLFAGFLSKAQFKEGYIITNINDTIYGYISFDGAAKNAFQCIFKEQPEGSLENYSPGEIQAFRFINSKYFSTDYIEIENTITPVFLEWLIRGEANVLSFTPENWQVRYFLKLQNDSLIELKNSSISKNIENNTYEYEKREYVGQLKYNFSDQSAAENLAQW